MTVHDGDEVDPPDDESPDLVVTPDPESDCLTMLTDGSAPGVTPVEKRPLTARADDGSHDPARTVTTRTSRGDSADSAIWSERPTASIARPAIGARRRIYRPPVTLADYS